MKNITFSVDEHLLKNAREKARREHRSLNELFRTWLKDWTQQNRRDQEYDDLMSRLSSSCDSGGSFSRDEMND